MGYNSAMSAEMRLERSFYARPTLIVARQLLGKRLVRIEPSGDRLSGWIVEAEAYIGSEDLGCHAKSGRTARNRSMWGPAGHAYVYFTYGMHWMLNVVTEAEGFPAAVLIRALLPLEGIETMQRRRSGKALADGPAKLCQALAIDRNLDGRDLCSSEAELFIENEPEIEEPFVTSTPRVGLNSVPEPWKSIPWRFLVARQTLEALLKEERAHEAAGR
jgi:DNA-3-methyladenine glycosylase